jgi:hypothetical protein
MTEGNREARTRRACGPLHIRGLLRFRALEILHALGDGYLFNRQEPRALRPGSITSHRTTLAGKQEPHALGVL